MAQVWVFIRNLQAIGRLGKLFPNASFLQVEETTEVDLETIGTTEVPQLKDNNRFSAAFRDIIQMTNDYLRRNKGSSQGERLAGDCRKKVRVNGGSDRNQSALCHSTLALLATFTGVIIGSDQDCLCRSY